MKLASQSGTRSGQTGHFVLHLLDRQEGGKNNTRKNIHIGIVKETNQLLCFSVRTTTVDSYDICGRRIVSTSATNPGTCIAVQP